MFNVRVGGVGGICCLALFVLACVRFAMGVECVVRFWVGTVVSVSRYVSYFPGEY